MSGGIGVFSGPGLFRSGSDQTNLSLNNLPPDLALKAEHINRRQHIADLLLQQSTQPIQGQMAGRFYVPPNWMQGIAQLGKAAIGGYLGHQNEQELQGLGQEHKQRMADAVDAYFKGISGTPEQPGQPMEVTAQGPGAPVENPIGQVDPAKAKQNYLAAAGMTDLAPEGTYNPQATADYRNQTLANGDSLEAQEIARRRAMMTEGPQPTATVMSPPTPAQPATPEQKRAAIIGLMTSGHPAAQALLQMQQHEDQTKATQDYQTKEHQAQREFTHGENQAKIATELIKARGQIDTMVQLGLMKQDYADTLKRDLADQAETLKRDMASQQQSTQKEIAKGHDATQREIAKMNADAKKEAATTGKVPPGYRTTPDGNLQAIPGGPADLKLQGAFNQDTAMLQNSHASLDRLASTANQLLNHPGLAGIVGVRGKIPDIPGTDAANARALINTLKSQVGFGVLQEMRNNSKTGGALGNVSDAEGKRLENNLAALDTTQGLEQFRDQLKNGIIGYVDQAKDRLREAYNMKHGDKAGTSPTAPSPSGGPQKISSDADYNALPSGSTFIAPDGTTRKKP